MTVLEVSSGLTFTELDNEQCWKLLLRAPRARSCLARLVRKSQATSVDKAD